MNKKEIERQRHKAKTKKRRERYREAVVAIKLARGCENKKCQWVGEFHPWMLEFDHINPATKLDEVPKLVGKVVSWQRIEDEIAKCQVLCSNCHAYKTYLERH